MKNNFTFDFFIKRRIYKCYSNIRNVTTDMNYVNPDNLDSKSLNDTMIVRNIPPYFDALPRPSLEVYRIKHRLGFLADLKGYPNLEAYMKVQFRPKSRSRMRSLTRRLETCFPIQYKFYYGEISRQDYTFLFKSLHQMIQRRFLQRGDEHQALKHWDYLEENVFGMILEKKASFFVMFNNDKPIDICLNYHHQNIFRNYIRSYDIDYSKFRPGYVDIWKQLEWCFENDYLIFDLSYGDLAYKRTWCNITYKFEQHIIYSKSHYGQRLKALIISWMLQLKWHLEGKQILRLNARANSKLKKHNVKEIRAKPLFIKENISNMDLKTLSLSPIDINDDEFTFLRKPTFDFQYLNSEHSRTLRVFQLKDQKNTYIISGKTKKMKLVHNPSAKEQ